MLTVAWRGLLVAYRRGGLEVTYAANRGLAALDQGGFELVVARGGDSQREVHLRGAQRRDLAHLRLGGPDVPKLFLT